MGEFDEDSSTSGPYDVAHPFLQPVIPIPPDCDAQVPLACGDKDPHARFGRMSNAPVQEMIRLVPRTQTGFATKEMMLQMYVIICIRTIIGIRIRTLA